MLCPVLIGRDGELRILDDAVDAARSGQGGCAVVLGEPGIGKSRLTREAAARAAPPGPRCSRAGPFPARAAFRTAR